MSSQPEVILPFFTQNELERKAVVHRNRRMEGKNGHLRATRERTRPEVLARWQVNYLRHQYTDYDSGASTYRRNVINTAIAENFSWLTEEVNRQNSERSRDSFLKSLIPG